MISYLQVENLTKYYGDVLLFKDLSFGINKDQKVALIARNGAGKTTLLNIISGKEEPDNGHLSFKNDIRIGFLEQEPNLVLENTVLQEVFQAENEMMGVIREYELALKQNDANKLQKLIIKMDSLQAWDVEVKAKQVLSKLKLTDFDKQVKYLSGGQQKRVALAKVLISEPDLYILDEPTNHLDLDMIEWLEDYLLSSSSTIFMVTHDRYFLDRVCNEIMEMDNHQVYNYNGNYSYFLEKRAERQLVEQANLDKARNLYRGELEWMRRQPKARGTKAKYRQDAFKEIQQEALKKSSEDELNINVKTARLGKKIIEVKHVSKKFDDLSIINDFSYNFNRFEKIGIVGENGSGKSTFLNILTGIIHPDTGEIEKGETIKFGYYKQEGIQLAEDKKVIEVAREIAEIVNLNNGQQVSVSQFLTKFLFSNEIQYAYVSTLSGGEKRRLYLCTVLMQNPNFLILDEPTNDLDILTLNVLEDYLRDFQGCVIIVSHDRFFMDKIVDQLFVFEGDGEVMVFPGGYSLYRNYLESKQKKEETSRKKEEKEVKDKPRDKREKKLSYKEKRELEELEKEIEKLEEEKSRLEDDISSGKLKDDVLIEKSERLGVIMKLLDEKSDRWLELSENQ